MIYWYNHSVFYLWLLKTVFYLWFFVQQLETFLLVLRLMKQSVALHGYETRTIGNENKRKLTFFDEWCYTRMLHIGPRERIIDEVCKSRGKHNMENHTTQKDKDDRIYFKSDEKDTGENSRRKEVKGKATTADRARCWHEEEGKDKADCYCWKPI